MAKNDKKIKEKKYRSEEQREVIRFFVILISVLVVVGVVYGVSRLFIKETNPYEDEVTEGEINYDVVTVGTMFNRSDNEYYVALYEKDDPNAILYSAIINKYSKKDSSLKVYFCDLTNTLNKEYIKDVSNPNAKTIDDVAFGEFTFVKIKSKKIVKYFENIDDVKKELNI